jgi:ribosomal protein S4
MIIKPFKNKRKLLYKKCLNFRTNIQYKKRLLLYKFKKRKWENFLDFLRRTHIRRGSNYKLYDVTRYSISQSSFFFSKNYKRVLHNIRKTLFYFGGLKKQFLKKQISYLNSRKEGSFKNIRLNYTTISLLNFLERRLDVVLYRALFVSSILAARRLIQHGHVKVNDRITTENSTRLCNNDRVTFSIVGKVLVYECLKESRFWPLPPKYLVINFKTFEIIFLDVLKTHNYSLSFPSFLPNFHLLVQSFRYV